MGEAASRAQGKKPSNAALGVWFKDFYYGFKDEFLNLFHYEDIIYFKIAFRFRPDDALADEDSAKIFTTCIRPLILPTGIAAGRTQTPSYEFYHPSTYARQLGFGQVPIDLCLASQIKARETVSCALEYNRITRLDDSITLGDLIGYVPHYSCTKPFMSWWAEWKQHLFSGRSSPLLAPLSLPESDTEITWLEVFSNSTP